MDSGIVNPRLFYAWGIGQLSTLIFLLNEVWSLVKYKYYLSDWDEMGPVKKPLARCGVLIGNSLGHAQFDFTSDFKYFGETWKYFYKFLFPW